MNRDFSQRIEIVKQAIISFKGDDVGLTQADIVSGALTDATKDIKPEGSSYYKRNQMKIRLKPVADRIVKKEIPRRYYS